MTKTRVLVELKIDGNVAVLQGIGADSDFREVLSNGDTYEIGNQMRGWDVSVYHTKLGGVLKLTKYGNNNNVIDEYKAYDGRMYLLAATSGAARNGAFHNYKAPVNVLEKTLFSKGWGFGKNSLQIVPNIDMNLRCGGFLSWHNEPNINGIIIDADGELNDISEPIRITAELHPNIIRTNPSLMGVMDGYYETHVTGGRIVLNGKISQPPNGIKYWIPRIWDNS